MFLQSNERARILEVLIRGIWSRRQPLVHWLIPGLVIAVALAACGDFSVYDLEIQNHMKDPIIIVPMTRVGPLDAASEASARLVAPGTTGYTEPIVIGPVGGSPPTDGYRATIYLLGQDCQQLWTQEVGPATYRIVINEDHSVTLEELGRFETLPEATPLPAVSACGFAPGD